MPDRSRQELPNEFYYLVFFCKIGFDTAEKEPSEICHKNCSEQNICAERKHLRRDICIFGAGDGQGRRVAGDP